jgi:hypothetical protein
VEHSKREQDLEFLESMITELLKLSFRGNFRELVFLLGMAKVATAEARRRNPRE